MTGSRSGMRAMPAFCRCPGADAPPGPRPLASYLPTLDWTPASTRPLPGRESTSRWRIAVVAGAIEGRVAVGVTTGAGNTRDVVVHELRVLERGRRPRFGGVAGGAIRQPAVLVFVAGNAGRAGFAKRLAVAGRARETGVSASARERVLKRRGLPRSGGVAGRALGQPPMPGSMAGSAGGAGLAKRLAVAGRAREARVGARAREWVHEARGRGGRRCGGSSGSDGASGSGSGSGRGSGSGSGSGILGYRRTGTRGHSSPRSRGARGRCLLSAATGA
jgi:hypothetical protein